MYVYILSNNSQVLYIGVTNNLHVRMFQHTQERDPDGFVGRYNLDRLVYYEEFSTPIEAIAREKQLKGWNRSKKKRLIQTMNPMWRNLLEDLRWSSMEIPPELR
jgi:putative endonuclease